MAARVKLRYKGFQDLRVSPEVQELVRSEAEAIQRRAGENFEAGVSTGKTSVGRVWAVGAEGMRAEAKHSRLSNAFGGG